MGWVLLLAVGLWFGGARIGLSAGQRTTLLVGLWLVMVVTHLALPATHPLRVNTGGDVRAWLVLALVVAGVLGYRRLLTRLHRRAEPPVPEQKGPFAPGELPRYARHIILREIGGAGQRKLKQARVLVIGAGGLGSPALMYLAAAGVGTIGVIDDDEVETSNLQRQIIHAEDRTGMPKVFSAEKAMLALNPHVAVRPYKRRLTAEIAADLFADYDLVLDGSDNFDTRYLANEVCVKLGLPLIGGAITQWEGQLSVWHPGGGGPCYACVFPVRPAPGMVPTCAEAGVAAPLPGIIGAMMAMEAVKLLTGAGEVLRGRLMIHDALYAETRVIAVERRAGCEVCGESRAAT